MDRHLAPADDTAQLMALLPPNARSLVELGASGAALARRYKQAYPACCYQGIEGNAERAALARQHCEVVYQADIERAGPAFFARFAMVDCWIFDDVLDTLRDPWQVLAQIRAVIAADASIVMRVRNSQHWVLQARLNAGSLRYDDADGLQRSRWRLLTRASMLDMFQQAGFRVAGGMPLLRGPEPSDAFKAALLALAQAGAAADPAQALADAMPTHYLIKVVPA